jgi:hypothetical protein
LQIQVVIRRYPNPFVLSIGSRLPEKRLAAGLPPGVPSGLTINEKAADATTCPD